ncbi:MAG TPA: transcriptional repressor LexA [Thermodesulfobacteriota bacterium]|nr:transcriptional repressor LexA [Thermodesulfobacteriota bacterium]
MEREKLTQTQEKALNFLREFLGEKGFPPTLREIASHFGLKGPKGPQKTLHILERKGYIRKTPGGSRAIEILKPQIGRLRTAMVQGRRSGLLYEKNVGSTSVPTVSLPIVGRVTAGDPILAIENIEGYVNFDRNLVSSEDVFLLRVKGDSMIDAHIQDGDFALVKPQKDAENGEIIVALIDDEATIKRIFKKRDLIRLEPANPNMEPIVVKKGEKRITIIGKVIGIFRKI